MNLQPIIEVWQQTVAQFDKNIAKCGRQWSPEYIAKLRVQQQAVRDCITELQTPGITPEQVVDAITRECRAILAAQ